jgi:thiol-disulfide isomerase/thioredoxin
LNDKTSYLLCMKKYSFLVLAFLLFTGWVMAQPSGSNAPRITEESVVKDSTGTVFPASVWKSLLSTGKYTLKPLTPGSKDTEFVLIRLTEEQQKKRFENMPRPRESPFFSTGKKPRGFSAKDMQGNKYKLKDLEGKVVVLNFWFVACGPCRMEIPELNKLVEEYKDSSNVVFLAVALDSNSEVEQFLEKLPFNYNIITDGRYISSIYSITSYPTHAIIDKSGNVIFHSTGYGMSTLPWIRKSIAKALL